MYRVKKEFSIIVDTANSLDLNNLTCHQVAKPVVQILIFCKPPVSTEIKPIAFILNRSAQTAHKLVFFEYGYVTTLGADFVTGGQATRTPSQDDNVFGLVAHWDMPFRDDAMLLYIQLSNQLTRKVTTNNSSAPTILPGKLIE